MGRKVITLDADSFGKACERLENVVIESGFEPDLILSIRTGGLYVGESIFPDVAHSSVKLQRPSTNAKKVRLSTFVLRHTPRPILDRLRIAESWWLERRPHHVSTVPFRLPEIPASASRILIVDDAIDSGATMAAIVRAVKASHPKSEVKSAVITQTTVRPIVEADYTLYNNQTLIRFPWSMDA